MCLATSSLCRNEGCFNPLGWSITVACGQSSLSCEKPQPDDLLDHPRWGGLRMACEKEEITIFKHQSSEHRCCTECFWKVVEPKMIDNVWPRTLYMAGTGRGGSRGSEPLLFRRRKAGLVAGEHSEEGTGGRRARFLPFHCDATAGDGWLDPFYPFPEAGPLNELSSNAPEVNGMDCDPLESMGYDGMATTLALDVAEHPCFADLLTEPLEYTNEVNNMDCHTPENMNYDQTTLTLAPSFTGHPRFTGSLADEPLACIYEVDDTICHVPESMTYDDVTSSLAPDFTGHPWLPSSLTNEPLEYTDFGDTIYHTLDNGTFDGMTPSLDPGIIKQPWFSQSCGSDLECYTHDPGMINAEPPVDYAAETSCSNELDSCVNDSSMAPSLDQDQVIWMDQDYPHDLPMDYGSEFGRSHELEFCFDDLHMAPNLDQNQLPWMNDEHPTLPVYEEDIWNNLYSQDPMAPSFTQDYQVSVEEFDRQYGEAAC